MKAVLDERASAVLAFWLAPDDSFHSPETVAVVVGKSQHTLSNMRCKGGGIAFVKDKQQIYYRKADVLSWFRSLGESVPSTSALTVRG